MVILVIAFNTKIDIFNLERAFELPAIEIFVFGKAVTEALSSLAEEEPLRFGRVPFHPYSNFTFERIQTWVKILAYGGEIARVGEIYVVLNICLILELFSLS